MRPRNWLRWSFVVVAALGSVDRDAQAGGDRPAAEAPDPDRDGDGLSDFLEVHTYRTDPTKADTAEAGRPDGDPAQRREFTYSVRAVIRVMPPYNLARIDDDYQDVQVLAETPEYAELEVVVYPLNSLAEAVEANPDWREDAAGMVESLAPGVTTNWDADMRGRLLTELARAGIDPGRLTDKEVVEQVSRWMYGRSTHRNMFCTYFVHFPGGKAAVLPGLEEAFQREKGDPACSAEEQFAHELFGKAMFERKVYGTCTSAAVAQATVLRAVGIPTRFVVAIPVVDASDDEQRALAARGLAHHGVRNTVLTGLAGLGSSFSAHTFLEVYVGRRWRRLNYTTFGQNVLDSTYLGLMVHVHTFHDLSEAGLAETWGARYALGRRDGEFRHSNPYRTIALDDHFGRHAEIPNPPSAKEHRQITLDRTYWPDAEDASAEVRNLPGGGERGGGRFFVHGVEWFEDAGDHLQYKLFMQRADGDFVLSAEGRPDVPCRVSRNFVTGGPAKLRELELVIPPADFAAMARGVAYTLSPKNSVPGYRWRVKDGLTLTLDPSPKDELEALRERVDRLEKRLEALEAREDRDR